MPTNESASQEIDWSLTTWEGARREQVRRWSKMTLAEIILALEDMQVIADRLSESRDSIDASSSMDSAERRRE